jgi:UDP-N-acetylmuramate dehydrogenase
MLYILSGLLNDLSVLVVINKMTQAAYKLEELPAVRGRYTENAPIGAQGWFKCGGSAAVQFKPADLGDLQEFLQNCPPDMPVHVFGALSNTIIRDGGLDGVVIRLGREFSEIETDGDLVMAGALALDANVAQVAAEAGLAGLEFFSGIPGTIGGAMRMNAGCYGRETKDVLVECRALDRQGNLHVLKPEQMGMTYRHVDVPEDYIFIDAVFRGISDDPAAVSARMKEIKERREASQPIREKTGGSTFANPSPEDLEKAGLNPDTKVWQLIESVGGRGLMVGGAQMSEKHCNFMINTGAATAADLEALGEELRKRVLEKHGIQLRWEIKRMGAPA